MTPRSRTAILALVASFGILTATSQAQKQSATRVPASAQNASAEFQAGIAQLRIAKGYLEKAGDKWGGYRVKSIASIDQAFKAMGVSSESTPAEMESGNIDEPTMLNKGIASLQNARGNLARAGKAKGVQFIDQAFQDLQEGINWAKQHKTY